MNSPDPPAGAAGLEPAQLETRPTLFLVYTVHLDTQWRWTVQDTIRRFLPATVEGNLDLFERHPARVLSFEGAFRYRLIEEYHPAAFERLREAVRRGNWRPAGTMLDAPDVNCAAPESLLRHILYARRYFESRFGFSSDDLFLPDCFGFGHALPSLAAHCGLTGFSAQKFGKWGTPGELPFDIGLWLGPDGEGVVAALRPEGYGEGLREDLSRAERWIERIESQRATSGLRVGYMYVGLGDRGGSLDEESLDWIDRSVRGDGPLRVVQTASDTLFSLLTPEQRRRLPRHRGELLLPVHGTGCWTSQAAAKRWNRACERQADVAERAAVLASWLGAMDYPAQMLRQAWERFLWHQMHDDLTGTSLPEAYRFTWNDQLIARNQFDTVAADAVDAAAAALDTSGPGEPLVIFNPLERPRCDVVEAEIAWAGAPLHIEAVGPGDEVVPVQVVERRTDRLRILFAPALPALGLAVWRLRPAAVRDPRSDLEAAAERIANRHVALDIDQRGEITSLTDRRTGEPLLAEPLRLELLPDRSRRWPAWEIRHRDVAATARRPGGGSAPRLVESGPVRAVVEIRRRHRGSRWVERIALPCGAAGSRCEIEIDVDWRSRGRLLKAALGHPPSGEAVYGLGCGTIRRGVNSERSYEVPGLWAAPADGAVALLAAGPSGWDRPDAATLRLSLLRSPAVGRKFRHQGAQDLGRHRLRFAVAPHVSIEATEEEARRYDRPPVVRPARRHDGPLGRSVSLLELPAGIAVRALKGPEEGPGMIVRLQETGGAARREVRLETATTTRAAIDVDGCETPRADLTPRGAGVDLELGPYALRTLRLQVERPQPAAAAGAWDPIALGWSERVTSRQGEAGLGRGPYGWSIPAESWPERIRVGAVPFTLGPADSANALPTAGGELTWEGEGAILYLVAASVDRPRRVALGLGARKVRLEIEPWDGLIGRFKGWRRGLRHLQWARPGGGFVRRTPLAWVAGHRHDADGRDLPYEPLYLFRHAIELEPHERRLLLPREPAVLLFAATLAR